MTLKEFVANEVESLSESELQAVADYVAFLRFRARASLDNARLASLYDEFEAEDCELAQAGMTDYAAGLSQEDK